jgi:hypothetical protein
LFWHDQFFKWRFIKCDCQYHGEKIQQAYDEHLSWHV